MKSDTEISQKLEKERLFAVAKTKELNAAYNRSAKFLYVYSTVNSFVKLNRMYGKNKVAFGHIIDSLETTIVYYTQLYGCLYDISTLRFEWTNEVPEGWSPSLVSGGEVPEELRRLFS